MLIKTALKKMLLPGCYGTQGCCVNLHSLPKYILAYLSGDRLRQNPSFRSRIAFAVLANRNFSKVSKIPCKLSWISTLMGAPLPIPPCSFTEQPVDSNQSPSPLSLEPATPLMTPNVTLLSPLGQQKTAPLPSTLSPYFSSSLSELAWWVTCSWAVCP